MLTCKVGNTIINCFDGTYDKYTLKDWSDKNRLTCPDCNKSYEYCHGEVVSPYFRHKEKSKECDEVYSEPETEEHIKGKVLIYNWLLELQSNGLVQNVKLEGYIPETRQRPDIYFEMDGKRYIMEFQCTPIATEYFERHRLYQLANINDIWIMGLEKYNLKNNDGGYITHSNYYKVLEKNTDYYLDVESNSLIIPKDRIQQRLPYQSIWLFKYYSFPITDFSLSNEEIMLNDEIVKTFINNDIAKHGDIIEKQIQENKEKEIITTLVSEMNDKFKGFKKGIYTFGIPKSHYIGKYKYKITFYDRSFEQYVYFIKEDCVDCCVEYTYSKPFVGKRGGLGWNKCTGYKTLFSMSYQYIDKDLLKKFILDKVHKYIRQKKYGY